MGSAVKITRERGGEQFPLNAVVVRVERGLFPRSFSSNSEYDEMDKPYQRVHKYNLVIVPSGVVNSQNEKWNQMTYSFVYSGASGRVYQWFEYHKGDYYEPGLSVGGPLILVDCLPNKDHHKPPRVVNVYASTAGVVWLALRASLGFPLWGMMEGFIGRMTCLDDAPFNTYLDKLTEEQDEFSEEFVTQLSTRLRTFFGMTP